MAPLIAPSLSRATETFQVTVPVPIDTRSMSRFDSIAFTIDRSEELDVKDTLIMPISLGRTPTMDFAIELMNEVFVVARSFTELSKSNREVTEVKEIIS